MISTTILAVLAMIESILPLLGTSAATVDLIAKIIAALTALMPYIVDEISTVYEGVKNIISQLSSKGEPTPDQLAALQSLDAQVDAAWLAIEVQIDPDAPGGVQ